MANIANDKNYLTKTKIITVDGDDLGNISDLYFSLPYGNVEEFEVSGGLISDLKSGRNTISISDIVTIGQDATIVKSYAGAKIESQNKTQGVQGVATNAAGIAGVVGDKAKTAWEMAMTKVGEVKEYVSSGNLKSDTDNFMESAKTKAQEVKKDLDPKIENFKERVADMASQTKDKAQDIGSQMKAKADEMAADIKDKAQDIKEDMSPKVDNMKEEARDMGSNMQYEAQNMVSDAKDFAQEKTNQATQSVQSGLKNVALGQYLKINIIGQDDEIIGAIGDLVTREIFDAAERNGQLNKLLANLSKDPIYL